METDNKVDVRIFGHDYTIRAPLPEEMIRQSAMYADGRMKDLGKRLPSISTLSLAILTSVNIAGDVLTCEEEKKELKKQVEDLLNQQKGLTDRWEEAKLSFLKYQNEAQNSVEQLQELQRIFNAKNLELNQVKEQLDEMTAQYEKAQADFESSQALLSEMSDLEKKYQDAADEAASYREEAMALRREMSSEARARKNEDIGLEAMTEKYKELENSFFDIQMENINLKNELDELRKK